ncbi:V-set and immunoglobulin domain-containing protein 10 [Esox lucius]|uniref:Ig-like domain-containing protein n=1 Tax=Esox lucius TaxID=8010 RepID=A0A3P8ZHH5_ESOLU|nr:V-set and immunoglobulin domain-containing protein 10 [Esox lucius]
MKGFTVAFFLTFIHQTGAANGSPDETVLYGTLGESIVLPCCNTAINVTPTLTQWMKNGQLIIDSNHSKIITPLSEAHLTILNNQSLYINVLARSDQGDYICVSLPNEKKNLTNVKLQIVSGPDNGITVIGPAKALPNGTLFIQRGSRLALNCSSLFYPSQRLSWWFQGVASSNESLAAGNGSWLNISIEVQPKDQGIYSCRAQNSVSEEAVVGSKELLVYYPPERSPECMWRVAKDLNHVQFNCSWFGGYPTPTLFWGESHIMPGSQVFEQLMQEEETVSLVVNLNRSLLLEEENLRCYGHHPTIRPEEEKFCLFTLRSPYPSGNPLVTALEGTNVTLTCTESISVPPAITTWQKTIHQEDVIPSAKYVMSENGPVFSLTIVNVTMEDEGFYFCRSENPLMVRELEIQLTVKYSSQYTGAVIGVFLAILVVGSGVVIAKILYSRRDRICLDNGFGRMEEETGDVISLVDSDEEFVFEEAVPRLPSQPVANGHNTTFVQIHRIPSNDHEDAEIVEHPLQLEHTTDTEELVTF